MNAQTSPSLSGQAAGTPVVTSATNLRTLTPARIVDVCHRMEQLHDRCLYLDALRAGQQILGRDLHRWPSAEARIMAARLAGRLGGHQRRSVLLYLIGRQYPDHPQAQYFTALSDIERRPFAHVWLHMHDHELNTPDSRLRACWIGLKARLMAGMRDFDRANAYAKQALKLAPDEAWIHVNQAVVLVAQDDVEGAISSCQDALTCAPRYGPAIQSLGYYLTELNRIDEAFHLLSQAVDHSQCGSMRLQLAIMLRQREQFAEAASLLDGIEKYFPLADPTRGGRPKQDSLLASLAAIRSDLAFDAGDPVTSVEQARQANSKFYDAIANHISENFANGKRVKLDVPFVRQDHKTCAPATLAMLCGYWNVKVDHDRIADQICYDGTAAVEQRVWAEQNGLIAKEFRVTEESSKQLIDAGIPFAITTVEAGSAHIQVICGFDTRKGVWLIQDPGSWFVGEARIAGLLEEYAWTGPRGLVLIPRDRSELLQAIQLPEREQYDQQHELALALRDHHRERAVSIVASLCGWDPDHRQTLWAQAAVARYDYNSPAELEAISRLSQKFPDAEPLLLSETSLLAHLDRTTQVVQRLRAAVDSCSVGAETYLRLASLLEDEADADEANRLVRKVLRYAPTNWGGLTAEAQRLWNDKQRDAALELFRLAAMASEANESAARNYLQAARQLGREESVLEHLRQRFERNGRMSGQPAITYAAALEQSFETDKAVDVLYRALDMRPEDGELLCQTARMLGRLVDPQKGLELLDATNVKLPELEAWETRAVLAQYDGRPADALHAYRAMAKLQPADPDIIDCIAGLLDDLEGTEAALDYLLELVHKFPHCRDLLCSTVSWLHHSARFEEALEYVDRLLESHPSDAWAWRERSLLNRRLHRYDRALSDAERGLACESGVISLAVRADALVDLTHLDEAKRGFQEAIADNVDYEYAITGWLNICADDSERKEVLTYVFSQLCVQRTNGNGLAAYYTAAGGLLEPRLLEETLRFFQKMRPDLYHSHLVLSNHLREHGQLEEAEKCLLNVQERFSSLPIYWRELGDLYDDMRDTQQTIEAYEQGIALTPHWSELAWRLSTAYEKNGRPEDAVATLHRALSGCPNEPSMLLALSKLTEQDSEALALLRQAALVAPAWDAGWQELHCRAAQCGQDELAVATARELVARRPKDAQSHLRLAEMLNGEEQYEESIAAIQSAMKLDKRRVEVHRLFAQRLAEKGCFDAALDACNPPDVDPRLAIELDLFAAELLYFSDRKTEACDRLHEALRKDASRASEWARLADWAEELENHELYDAAVSMLLERAPQFAATHGYHHTTLLRMGKRSEAKEALRRALAIDPEYQYGLRILFQMHMEDEENSQARALLENNASIASPEVSLPFRLTLECAECKVAPFMQYLNEICQEENCDYLSYLNYAFEHVDESSCGAVFPSLTERMRDPQAQAVIGFAWQCASGQLIGFDQTLACLEEFPTSLAWHAAAQRLTSVLTDYGSKGTKELSMALPILQDLAKRSGMAILTDAITWSDLVYVFTQLDDLKAANALAARFSQVAERTSADLVPAMLAAMQRGNWGLLDQLLLDSTRPDMETLEEAKVLRAVYLLFCGSVQEVRTELASVDARELRDWFRQSFAMLTTGLECLEAGDETALLSHWEEAQEEVLEIDQQLYHRLRFLIAKRQQRWISMFLHYWKSR